MLSFLPALLVFLVASQDTLAINFPSESVVLKDSDVGNNSDIAFGKLPVAANRIRCKVYPGDSDWPSTEKWNAFNATLNGALIKGIPPAAVCYAGPYFDETKCAIVKQGSYSMNFVKEDPTIPGGQWQLGNPCPAPVAPFPGFNITLPTYTCNITAFPAYVVNATTVKQIQLAVNFARNNNIRITIKNTGHDYIGRNTGAGALQIWTHHLKQFEYLPSTQIAKYNGRAARVGSALEQYELFTYMERYNMTMLAPGSTTVGAYGGFMGGGGFSYITTYLGLMADQVLSFEIVTADGRFLHADPEENEDIFFAVRGGGPGNWGIVTSVVVKAYDPLPISVSNFGFQTNAVFGNGSTNVQVTKEVFWKGISTYFSHLVHVTDGKGTMWNTINHQPAISTPYFNLTEGNTMNNRVFLPGFQLDAAKEFLAPLLKDLNAVGVNITDPGVVFYETYPKQAYTPRGPGEGANNGRFASRLFPRANLVDPESDAFKATMASIRSFVDDGGYSFHSVDYSPTLKTAGYPGSSAAVNPHLRDAVIHATGLDSQSYGPETPPKQQIKNHARLNSFVQKWRDASPGSGAYMNEADTEEPNFQESFYGSNYARLSAIKKKVDPWGAFYAVTGVGSEGWRVEGTEGLPTQQGRLCRV